MNDKPKDCLLDDQNIKKIERAIEKVYTGDFIIWIPIKIRIVKGKIRRIKELKVEIIQRDLT